MNTPASVIKNIAYLYSCGEFSKIEEIYETKLSGKLANYNVYKYCHLVLKEIQKINGGFPIEAKKAFVSIVTINLNNIGGLKKTFDSVVKQSARDDIQFIVLDGGSSDGSLAFLSENSIKIDLCLYGKDSGIYNAMNRACYFLNSEYTIFMNSGDSFSTFDCVDKVRESVLRCDFSPEAVFGTVDLGGGVFWRPKPLNVLWKGMAFSHQSLFLKSTNLQNEPFNEKRKIVADFELIYRTFVNKGIFFDSGITIASIEPAGISSDFVTRTMERWDVVRNCPPSNKSQTEIDEYYLDLLTAGENNSAVKLEVMPRKYCKEVQEKLIFIISMPRSGSTLLQKMLERSNSISSAGEPWLMLPLLSMYDEELITAKYSQSLNIHAKNELLSDFGKSETHVLDAQKSYADSIYTTILDKTDKAYFLDKTPRYIYIAQRLTQIYPKAKYILLLRNPAEIISSYANTWFNGSYEGLLKDEYCKYDLVRGFLKLAEFKSANFHNMYTVRYEQLVKEPETVCKGLFDYLGLNYTHDVINYNDDNKPLKKYTFGDPSSVYEKKRPDSKNSTKWLGKLDTSEKRVGFLKALDTISSDAINQLGYSGINIRKSVHDIDRVEKQAVAKFFNYFDNVYCISLTRSEDRKDHIRESLEGCLGDNFSFFEATSVEYPEVREAYESGFVKKFPTCFRCDGNNCGKTDCNNILIPAQIATFFTYKNLWAKIVRDNVKTALIIEDDVVFADYVEKILSDENFYKKLDATGIKENKGVLLRLGWALCNEHQFDGNYQFTSDNQKMSNPCHAINIDFAKKCLSELKQMTTTVDVYQHVDVVKSKCKDITLMPPLAYELSWSTGKLSSLIHPKEVRVKYLENSNSKIKSDVEKANDLVLNHRKHVDSCEWLCLVFPNFNGVIKKYLRYIAKIKGVGQLQVRFTSDINQTLEIYKQLFDSNSPLLYSKRQFFHLIDIVDVVGFMNKEKKDLSLSKDSPGYNLNSWLNTPDKTIATFISSYIDWADAAYSNNLTIVRNSYTNADMCEVFGCKFKQISFLGDHDDITERNHFERVRAFLQINSTEFSDSLINKIKSHYQHFYKLSV